MNGWELFRSALLSLRAHKIRVLLTMVGIIVGISAVVAILSIGAGLKQQVNQSSDTTSVNTVRVIFEPETLNFAAPAAVAFDEQDLNVLEGVEGVKKVERGNELFGDLFGLIGEAEIFDKSTLLAMDIKMNPNIKMLTGRRLTAEDNAFENKVIVLSKKHATDLFGSDLEAAIGKGIKIKGHFFEVIGVTNDSGEETLATSDYIPKFAKDLIYENEDISSIDVKVMEGFDLDVVFEEIKAELNRLHPDLEGEYKQENPEDTIKAFQDNIGGITGFIALVTGISLFVGGIGVMNIMYVSVSERRREIGIRRAIGAKRRTILLQFLVEAVLITLTGGLLGILFGYGTSWLIGLFIPIKPVLTAGILLGSSFTSIVVGIIFGIIPAIKASNLSPIKAIYQ